MPCLWSMSCQFSSPIVPSVLIEDAQSMLRSLEFFKISHVFREGDYCADWVTKYVRDIEANVLLMNDFPSQLVQIAQADACGTCYERGWSLGLKALCFSQKKKNTHSLAWVNLLLTSITASHTALISTSKIYIAMKCTHQQTIISLERHELQKQLQQ